MSAALKDIYSPEFYKKFSAILKKVLPEFKEKKFTQLIFDENWEQRELKDRMNHTAQVLHHFLPAQYTKAAKALVKIFETMGHGGSSEMGFEYMFIPAYIEQFGTDYFATSVKTMERITQFASCEFAVRPFYLKYPEKMLAQTMAWAKHPNHMVRRLASEGCRPRLPWAMALPFLKKDPQPIIPILETLINDENEWVRRSVANNLNDIAKDHPDTVIHLTKKWQGTNANVDWVLRHGNRTLLKQGNTQSLMLFGFSAPKHIEIADLQIVTPKVKIGADLRFNFVLRNKAKKASKIRLEYGLYYKKANGSLARKVFQLSEKVYPGHAEIRLEKKQSFKIISTRKFYTGGHELSIIVNGQEFVKSEFILEPA